MPLSLLFRKKGRPNTVGGIELDVTLEEVHGRSAGITDHPIESGSMIQDHITNMPRMLQMTGFVTNSPVAFFSVFEAAERVQGTFDALEELYDSRQPFTVISGFRVYENMAFESLDMPRNREGALRFSAQMKQLTIVRSELALIPASQVAPGARDIGASESDAGRQAGAQPNEAQRRSGSLLSGIFFGGG